MDPIKLHLGARDKRIPGFLNIDRDPHPGVDLVGSADNLSLFDNCSIEAIYSSHLLEHFSHRKTLNVLQEWCRVLKSGGVLYVAVPDFKRVVDHYQSLGSLNQWMVDMVMCGHEYEGAYHYAIFDEKWLSSLLKQAGFSEASVVEEFPIGPKDDCSSLVSTYDLKPISLCMVAIK